MLSEQGLEVKKQLEEFNQLKRKINNLKMQLQEILELVTLPNKGDYKPSFTNGGQKISSQEKYFLKVEEAFVMTGEKLFI